MATFEFSFVRTRADAEQAIEAEVAARTRLSRLPRIAVGFVGLVFLLAAILDPPNTWWLGPVWAIVGSLLAWRLGLEPFLVKRRLRAQTRFSEHAEFAFGEQLVHIETSKGLSDRDWGELAGVLPSSTGVLLVFNDGTREWLPARVFHDVSAIHQFVDFVIAKAHLRT